MAARRAGGRSAGGQNGATFAEAWELWPRDAWARSLHAAGGAGGHNEGATAEVRGLWPRDTRGRGREGAPAARTGQASRRRGSCGRVARRRRPERGNLRGGVGVVAARPPRGAAPAARTGQPSRRRGSCGRARGGRPRRGARWRPERGNLRGGVGVVAARGAGGRGAARAGGQNGAAFAEAGELWPRGHRAARRAGGHNVATFAEAWELWPRGRHAELARRAGVVAIAAATAPPIPPPREASSAPAGFGLSPPAE